MLMNIRVVKTYREDLVLNLQTERSNDGHWKTWLLTSEYRTTSVKCLVSENLHPFVLQVTEIYLHSLRD